MIVILMGVAGVGKTTVGRLLAEKQGWAFFDADDFHPAANVEKMSSGIPLTDEDRWPWLAQLRESMRTEAAAGGNAIYACSALRNSYREYLAEAGSFVRFVYLKGDRELILERIRTRAGHFMREEMLAGQFQVLEEPEGCLTVEVDAPPAEVVRRVREGLGI
jgi:gluconokinase